MFRKKLLLTCAFMVCLSLCVLLGKGYTVKAEASVTKTSASGSKVTSSFNKKTGILTISGKGDMPADMQFGNNKKIKKVVIEEGVTSVCDYAFLGCTKLKAVTLPEGLLSIGVKSFENTNIKKITIPSSVRKIGQCAFWGCKKLKWITMPGDYEFEYEKNEPDEWMYRIVSERYAPKKITFTKPTKA